VAGQRNSIVIAIVVLIAIAGLALVANAVNEEVVASRVPYPVIAEGQGDKCVEDTDFMRRYHMTVLLHQRDDTMLKGIRTRQHSLKECISCHAVPGPDSIPVTVASPEHFCRSCHDYAAVKIDCFECHASRPEQDVVAEAGEE